MKRVGQAIYDSKQWKKLRQSYKGSQHGLCERCQQPGDVVHHIEPITSDNIHDVNITYGWNNLELLCHDCHNREHKRKHEPIREGFAFDSAGNLIKMSENEG